LYLKRIELVGFKSFADKTELEFVRGVTAVVGPNGSGKSNISDGIRWVLGEQSARSLRGGKMEDVIFAGSVARKAVNYGEVSLTLDNSDRTLPLDYSEVTVTRRVHRSGESEYFINKQPCRLKDITELFMDTGIGREAYSIIGQGRIEEILSTKSEDRRGIFEEASGIVKYKSRKKEAEHKLQDTEQNLLRIQDLVSELEAQIVPLKEQSEKALHFKQLRERLKANEISLYVHRIEQIYHLWKEAEAKLEALKQEQMALSAIVNRHDAQLETHYMKTRQLEAELEQLNGELLKLSEAYESCEGRGEVLAERKRNLEAHRERLAFAVESQQARVREREAEIGGLVDKINKISVELEACQSELLSEEQKLMGISGGTSSETEDRLKAEMLDVMQDMAKARNEVRYAQQQIEAIGRRLGRVREERAKWLAQREKTLARQRELADGIERVSRELSRLRDAYVSAGEELRSLQQVHEEALKTIRKWEQRLDALVSRKDTLLEMQNDYDGFMHGVKEVLKAGQRPDGLKGIHGAVAELVKVPAEYETALETAFGSSLQHIVVSSEADGREAIAFLKRRQLGRATFLPLDVIRGRSLPETDRRNIAEADGFVGIAVDLVRFDEPYRQVFASLLGNVIVARTLEQANHIAARCQYRYRVVTLEGDVVNPGGSMTGGSLHKKTSSLLGRKRVIEELEKEISEVRDTLARLRDEAGKVQHALHEGSRKLEELRQAGEEKRMEEQGLHAEMNPLSHELRNLDEQLSLLDQDEETLQTEIRQFEEKLSEGEQLLRRLGEEEVRLQQAVREAELSRKANESAKEELQTRLTDLKVKTAAVSQEKQSLLEQQRRLRTELAAARKELEDSLRDFEKTGSELAATETEIVKQTELLNDLRLKKERCAGQAEMKRAERAEWMMKLQQEENETREQRVKLKEVEDALRQTEVQANRLDVELESLLKKLSEEYELSFELAKARYPVPDDVDAAHQLVKNLKREIAELGEVNLGAIEEYARVSERYEFLNTQKNDLLEAKAALYQVIREMDEEMSKRFRQTFEAIRSQFGIVFAKLFGGGKADLVLSEPDNLLHTGVEIIAQPPGKKLQNLQLLSGGERALTAIALLFAILRVKPVPFCVLDEVEAALDEANVARFAEYLREFSAETQFIVVTHRKGTMEEADVLYGVTMEEGGVSKLVSVRLDEEAGLVSA